MGLLSDIWDGIRGKVKALIDSAFTNFKPWVRARISDAIAGIRQVTNYITEHITNVYKTVKEYITNVYNTVNEYVTKVYNNVTNYVTNKYVTTNEYITNVVGASREWVEEELAENRAWMLSFAKLMDPQGFLKDPIGYIKAAFDIQRGVAQNLVVKSFWEGFEEGLAE